MSGKNKSLFIVNKCTVQFCKFIKVFKNFCYKPSLSKRKFKHSLLYNFLYINGFLTEFSASKWIVNILLEKAVYFFSVHSPFE